MCSYHVDCQVSSKFAVFIENKDIIAGVGNRIEIVAQQNLSVSKSQVEFLYYPYLNSEDSFDIDFEGDNGSFLVKPNCRGRVNYPRKSV